MHDATSGPSSATHHHCSNHEIDVNLFQRSQVAHRVTKESSFIDSQIIYFYHNYHSIITQIDIDGRSKYTGTTRDISTLQGARQKSVFVQRSLHFLSVSDRNNIEDSSQHHGLERSVSFGSSQVKYFLLEASDDRSDN